MTIAMSRANDRDRELLENKIDTLEELREELDLIMSDIDDVIGKSSNWYAKRKRDSERRFTTAQFHHIKECLELEILRETAGVDPRDIDNAIGGRSGVRGWYLDELKLDPGLKITANERIRVFLTEIIRMEIEEGRLHDDDLHPVVKKVV